MGIFERFRSVAALPAGRFLPLPDGGHMRVVGESHYQETLSRIARGCVASYEGRPAFAVALIREPDNPYDTHAIAVLTGHGHVGYLPRDDARRFGATLATVETRGYHGATCTAVLNGGAPDRPSFGVVLIVASPEGCEEHLGR
jgi:hypothetical protein